MTPTGSEKRCRAKGYAPAILGRKQRKTPIKYGKRGYKRRMPKATTDTVESAEEIAEETPEKKPAKKTAAKTAAKKAPAKKTAGKTKKETKK